MIIVLKGADFSANNIGRVELPLVWDVDAKGYVDSLSSSSTFTDIQNRSINSLFVGLKSNDIYQSIKGLYLPIFGRIDGGKNIKNPSSNINLPNSGATYDNNGVLFSLGWLYPNTITKSNHTIGIYNTTPTTQPGGSGNPPAVSAAPRTTTNILGRKTLTNNTQAGYTIDGTIRPSILNHSNSVGLLAGGQSELLNKTSFFADSESIDAIYGGTATFTSFNIGGTTSGTADNLLMASIGVIFDSNYLSNEQVSIMSVLLDDIVNAFKN